MSYQQPRGWLVMDDSGSMHQYSDLARHVATGIKEQFRDTGVDLEIYTTSSKGVLYTGNVGPLGNGGGDGLRHLFETLDKVRDRGTPIPSFVIYITDGEPCLDNLVNEVVAHKMLIVDITSPFITGIGSFSTKTQAIFDCLLHDGDCPDIDECECVHGRCDCEDECEYSEWHQPFKRQPFFPNWSRWSAHLTFGTNKAAWSNGVADALRRISAQGHIAYFDEVNLLQSRPEDVVGPFRHPVDSDLNEINRAIDQCIGEKLEKRATLACDLNGKIKRLIGSNTLTPAQHVRIKATKYRIFTHLLNISHETVVKTIYGTDSIDTNTHTEVQEGQPMSAQITTTVSLKTTSSSRATLADLKTLITEVERVGGTDESFVDFDAHRRTGCLDAVVVTAVSVEVTPTLDPRVECVLSIQDVEKRTHALVDLLIDYPRLRSQITPHLVNKPEAKPAAKKTTAAKPAKA